MRLVRVDGWNICTAAVLAAIFTIRPGAASATPGVLDQSTRQIFSMFVPPGAPMGSPQVMA